MACASPITVKITPKLYGKPHYQQVPCGKCYLCLKSYQNSWAVRMYFECSQWSKVSFLTLTYRDDTIPLVTDNITGEVHNSLCKRHLQLWIKRIRDKLKYKQFKYFACGEYGDSTKRAHMHILFFGLDKYDIQDYIDQWENMHGFVYYEDVNLSTQKSRINSSLYVSKYTAKGALIPDKVKNKIVEPPFKLMSKGIGACYVNHSKNFHRFNFKYHFTDDYYDSYLSNIYDNLNVVIGKNRYSLPRYYRNKIFGNQTLLSAFLSRYAKTASNDRMCSELRLLYPSFSDDETFIYKDFQAIESAKYQNKSEFHKFAKFYNFKKF